MSARVLVTGGASGIGLGISRVLVEAGFEVVVCGRRQSVLADAEQSLGVRGLVWDLVNPQGLVQAAGPLTHLVHCAGNDANVPLANWQAQHFSDCFALHAVATGLLMRDWAAQAPKGGCFVGISSTLGRRSAPGKGPYAAAKAAMQSICQTGAMELAHSKLRVNAVLPGIVPTAMTRVPRWPGSDVSAQLEDFRRMHPLGRLGRPEEVGDAVRYLLEAEWVTGAELVVDGGLSL